MRADEQAHGWQPAPNSHRKHADRCHPGHGPFRRCMRLDIALHPRASPVLSTARDDVTQAVRDRAGRLSDGFVGQHVIALTGHHGPQRGQENG
jgi:hypothetical protein